jgi:hypothetical protein
MVKNGEKSSRKEATSKRFTNEQLNQQSQPDVKGKISQQNMYKKTGNVSSTHANHDDT